VLSKNDFHWCGPSGFGLYSDVYGINAS
jgi:hypothetical protein